MSIVDVNGEKMSSSAEAMIAVSEKEYKILVAATSFLNCLQAAGVDNWEGWDDAVENYNDLRGIGGVHEVDSDKDPLPTE